MYRVKDESLIVERMLLVAQEELLTMGLIEEPKLDDTIDYEKVVLFPYNLTFNPFVRRTLTVEPEDYSEIIDSLFLDPRAIDLKKPLENLPKKYKSEKIGMKVITTLRATNKVIRLNKAQMLVLKYNSKYKWENYLITTIKNKVLDLIRKTTVEYNYQKEFYNPNLLKSTTIEYNHLLEEEYNSLVDLCMPLATKHLESQTKQEMPKPLFKETLNLLGEGYTINYIAKKLKKPNKLVGQIVTSLQYSLRHQEDFKNLVDRKEFIKAPKHAFSL